MLDGIDIRATLTGLKIKPGKEEGDDPIVTVTIETAYDDELSALNGRIGHVVDLRVAFVQAALPIRDDVRRSIGRQTSSTMSPDLVIEERFR